MHGHLNESVGITIVLCTLPVIILRLLCFKIVAIKQSYIVSYMFENCELMKHVDKDMIGMHVVMKSIACQCALTVCL